MSWIKTENEMFQADEVIALEHKYIEQSNSRGLKVYLRSGTQLTFEHYEAKQIWEHFSSQTGEITIFIEKYAVEKS